MPMQDKQKFYISLLIYSAFSMMFVVTLIYYCKTFLVVEGENFLFASVFIVIPLIAFAIYLAAVAIGSAITQKRAGYLPYNECIKKAKQHSWYRFNEEIKSNKDEKYVQSAMVYFFFGLLPWALYDSFLKWRNAKNKNPEAVARSLILANSLFVYCAWVMNKQTQRGFRIFILGFTILAILKLSGVSFGLFPLLSILIFIFSAIQIILGTLEVL